MRILLEIVLKTKFKHKHKRNNQIANRHLKITENSLLNGTSIVLVKENELNNKYHSRNTEYGNLNKKIKDDILRINTAAHKLHTVHNKIQTNDGALN